MGRVLGDTGLLTLVVIAMDAATLVLLDLQSVKLVAASLHKDGIMDFENINSSEHISSY